MFPDTLGDKGLIMLPMIFGHFSQLIIDAFLCSIWLSFDKKRHPELFIEKGEETVDTNQPSLPVSDKRDNKKKNKKNKNKNDIDDEEESVPLNDGGRKNVVEGKKIKKGYAQLGDNNESDSDE